MSLLKQNNIETQQYTAESDVASGDGIGSDNLEESVVKIEIKLVR